MILGTVHDGTKYHVCAHPQAAHLRAHAQGQHLLGPDLLEPVLLRELEGLDTRNLVPGLSTAMLCPDSGHHDPRSRSHLAMGAATHLIEVVDPARVQVHHQGLHLVAVGHILAAATSIPSIAFQ